MSTDFWGRFPTRRSGALPRDRAPAIADYAAIGDGRSVALVANDGGVDWLCWPRFDSPSLFAALLDFEHGGRCVVRPRGTLRTTRRYLTDTNVLSTMFETADAVGTLVDLMPVEGDGLQPEHELLRIFRCEQGELELEVTFAPRPDYARAPVRFHDLGALGLRIEHGRSLYTLRADVPLTVDGDVATATVRLSAGQRFHLSLTYDAEGPAVLLPLAAHAQPALDRTVAWWRAWAGRCTYRGPYRDEVVRSLLALKLMSFSPSGAFIAAPTTSLPEQPGGGHNWDYRFCWLRDASLTVTALQALGYSDEAAAFLNWLLHATALTQPELRVLYDVYGRRPPRERELPGLDGHLGSKPVRINNAAEQQLQLDVYGEIVDAVTQLTREGLKLDRDAQGLLRGIGRFICKRWREPDHGIWEPREAPQRHVSSLLFCWVALDRLLELHRAGAVKRLDVEALTRERDAIRTELSARGFSERLQSYTDVLGGDSVDASALLISWYGFEPESAPRQRSTFAVLEERLSAGRGQLFRHEHSVDGAFGLCGFWAVQFLARGGGRLADAEVRFRALLETANAVGLYAEETVPGRRTPLGNFPQAFTHVGMLNAAVALEQRRRTEQKEAA